MTTTTCQRPALEDLHKIINSRLESPSARCSAAIGQLSVSMWLVYMHISILHLCRLLYTYFYRFDSYWRCLYGVKVMYIFLRFGIPTPYHLWILDAGLYLAGFLMTKPIYSNVPPSPSLRTSAFRSHSFLVKMGFMKCGCRYVTYRKSPSGFRTLTT